MTTTEPRRMLFKCKCGSVQFEVVGEPDYNCNCHCHSCVASFRYVDEKKGGGTTGLIDHGAAFSFFKPNQIGAFTLADSVTELGAVKVGEKGKNMRLYTPCCGSAVGFAMPKVIGLNRNALYEASGDALYQPTETVLNVQKSNAFDPEVVPEPSHNTVPISAIFSLMMTLLNPFGSKFDFQNKDHKLFFPELDNAETVEITWE